MLSWELADLWLRHCCWKEDNLDSQSSSALTRRSKRKLSHLVSVLMPWLSSDFTSQGNLHCLPAKFHLGVTMLTFKSPMLSKNSNSHEIPQPFCAPKNICLQSKQKTFPHDLHELQSNPSFSYDTARQRLSKFSLSPKCSTEQLVPTEQSGQNAYSLEQTLVSPLFSSPDPWKSTHFPSM